MKWSVGDRFQIKEEVIPNNFEVYRGTIRYMGPLENPKTPSSDQIWVGVEFDDSSRGKHNGIAFGKQIFTTYKNLNAASFFKLEKFTSLVQKKNTFLEALEQRYSHSEEEENEEIFLNSISGKKQILIEIVGKQEAMEFFSKMNSLTKISIQHQCFVDHVIDKQMIQQTCPQLQELDLSNNLLSNFQTVVQLCQSLLHLKSLNLSGNFFTNFEFDSSISFPSITILALTNTRIQWKHLLKILPLFPNICELYLSQNDFETVELSQQNIKVLDLSYNSIHSWDEILKLQHMPLQKLNLKSNLITHISKMNSFVHLESLFISNNSLETISAMNELNECPQLVELRCDHNPFYNNEDSSARVQVIARIKNLKVLNGSDIYKEERRDAEKYYLKQCAQQRMDQQLSLEQILLLHPRYMELVKELAAGDPFDSLQTSQMIAKNAKSKLITIVLKRENETVSKSIMPTATVQQLKQISQRLFKVKECKLERVNEPFNDPMSDDTKEVSYYGVENNSIILILDINRMEMEIQQRDKKIDLLERMKKHEEQISKERKVRQQGLL